jgi:hypothetical protein
MGDVVYLTAFRSARREARLQALKRLERECLAMRGLAACTACTEFPACDVWQESLRSVIGYVQDDLRCKPQVGDVVWIEGERHVVTRMVSALDAMGGLDVEGAARFVQAQRGWLGPRWMGLYYRVGYRTPEGTLAHAEWHQVESVERRVTRPGRSSRYVR